MAVCPGFIKTGFLDVSNVPARFEKSALTPQDVVKASLKALRRRRPCVVIGLQAKVMTFMPRLFPRAGVAWVSEMYMRPPKSP
jgi:short-subunit dehydrogenase